MWSLVDHINLDLKNNKGILSSLAQGKDMIRFLLLKDLWPESRKTQREAERPMASLVPGKRYRSYESGYRR
jgi:hypothetical protein